MSKNYVTTNDVVNGFWYSFKYAANNPVKGVDKHPFIFCIGPSKTSLNHFVGLNLHHLPITQRAEFIKMFQSLHNFMDQDTRIVLTEEQIEAMVPGIKIAFRVYDKRGIKSCVRVVNRAVPDYIFSKGNIIQEKPINVITKWLQKLGILK